MGEIFPRKAFVLAAGLGIRLGEITKEKPKCLIDVTGKPILLYQLEKLKEIGVTQVCINLHYKADQVRQCIAQAGDLGLEVVFSHEEELLDTGGALKHAHWFLDGTDPFFVINADILTGLPLADVAQATSPHSIATLGTMQRDEPSRLVLDEACRLSGLNIFEKPYPESTAAFTGISLYAGKIMRYVLAENRKVFSLKDVWKSAINDGQQIDAYSLGKQCSWFDVGTQETLQQARNYFAKYGKFQ